MTAIAIDGPAGAGKSFVARSVAEALGIRYLDTGAMYRAVAWLALEAGVDPSDGDAVMRIFEAAALEPTMDGIAVDGRALGPAIRGPDVTVAAARVAQHRDIRKALVGMQRRLSQEGDVVMEGRDIGTEVLPDAEVKIFLTASLDQRALRRCRQLGRAEDEATLAEIRAEISARDERDRTRAISPLVEADDATVLDTTDMTADQVVRRICEIAASAVRSKNR